MFGLGDCLLETKQITGEGMEAIISLTKRRGFIFPSGEIYGGLSGFWDYGPLGVELKRNLRDAWWQWMVTAREDIVGLDSAIITHPETWVASGHVEHFHDLMIDCKQCKKRFKADEIVDGICPNCGSQNLDRLISAPNLLRGRTTTSGTTCCGRTERCEMPPCSTDERCWRP